MSGPLVKRAMLLASIGLLSLAGCTGPEGIAPKLAIGRAVMVDSPIFEPGVRSEAPASLTSGIWGAMPEASGKAVVETGAAIQFTADEKGQILFEIVPAKASMTNGHITLTDFNNFVVQKGFKPADFAYAPDVPVKVVPLPGSSYATEFVYGEIHMLGLLSSRSGEGAGFEWNVWLDEVYLRGIFPAEPGIWWRIKGFVTRLFGIESDSAVRYEWEDVYSDKDGARIGRDFKFTEGGAQLAAFVRRHADRMFLKGRAIRLRLLTSDEFAAYERRPQVRPATSTPPPASEPEAPVAYENSSDTAASEPEGATY